MSVSNGPSIITSGLVFSVDAADKNSYPGSGTTWRDLSGNGNNGTLTNGPTFSSANQGSIVFDGTDDFVINSSTTNIPVGNSDRTICVWVYPETNTSNFVQIGTGGGGNQIYLFSSYIFTPLTYVFTDGVNTPNNIIISGEAIPTFNSWNYLVFTSAGQNYNYYKNAINRLSGTWPVTINTVGQKVVIGKRDENEANTLDGNIASVQIYNRALSASEVAQNYSATKTRFGL